MNLKTAFISNIAFDATEADLQELLDEFKPTHVRLVVDRDKNNKSRGFGFAEFKDQDGFDRCVNDLDGSHFMGRPLTVKEAEPRKANRSQSTR